MLILFRYTVQQPGYNLKLKKVYFLWIARNTASFEWFQDLISHMEGNDFHHFLEIHIYLTGGVKQSAIPNLYVNYADVDPITQLRSRTHYGRPNLPHLFQSIKETDKAKTVGVFFCGPKALGHQLRVQSHKQSDRNTKFVFSKEIF